VATLVLLVLAELGTFAVAAWQLSRWVETTLTIGPSLWSSPVLVREVTPSTVTLEQVEGGPTWLAASEVYGLDWGTGWGFVTGVREDDGTRVVRGLEVVSGEPPQAGATARFSRDVYPVDGRRAFPDEPVSELTVRAPTADLPAWFVPGEGDTWAVLVHGAGSPRSEMFRFMRTTIDLGMPSLSISYRGDQETGGGFARIGATEWEDLEAAVRTAHRRGARDVVLLGASMGGSVIATFLERSDLAGEVRAVVLDSPLLDFGPAVARAAEAGAAVDVPLLGDGPVAAAAIRLARARTPLDGSRTDHVSDTSWLDVPLLVLHGRSDPRVPVRTTEELARKRPDDVTAVVIDGAGHVEGWNAGPEDFERRVRAFLRPFRA